MMQVAQLTDDPRLNDYRWLISEAARPFLELASQRDVPLTTRTKSLRRALTPQQSHLILEQAELRQRGRVKFRRSRRMFFTRDGLQQSSDERVAAYKASRFPQGVQIADLCCGVGGDLLALASIGQGVGVERDSITAVFAQSNCHVHGFSQVEVHVRDARQFPVQSVNAWHIDPDRRPLGRRTTRIESYEPVPQSLDKLLERNSNGVVKLAPGAAAAPHWRETGELEWIGARGECQQQVVWFGDLAQHRGKRVATVLTNDGCVAGRVIGQPNVATRTATALGRYIFDPDSAVLAAGLLGELAESFNLAAVAPGIAYLTGEKLIKDGCLSCFETIEVLSLDRRRLKAWLRQRGVGRLEVKKRGVATDPARIRRSLAVEGDQSATLLLYPGRDHVVAVLAQRKS